MKFLFPLLTALLSLGLEAQNTQEITAKQIIANSISYYGGQAALSGISTLEMIYLHLDPQGKSASIVEKRKSNTHLTQSIISQNNDSQTTFYDGKDIVWVQGKDLKKFVNVNRQEIKLKSFVNILLAYEKTGFTYSRLQDQKQQDSDCFVIEAKNAAGYATINYFDKNNFRHLMTIFPDGKKSQITEDVVFDGIRFNKHIMETDVNGKQSQLVLVDVKVNSAISDLWFTSPFENNFSVPGHIRFGQFKAVGSETVIIRDSTTQTETSGDKTQKMQVDWKSDDMFELRTPEQLKGEGTVVRIVSWKNDRYICHIMGLTGTGTAEFVKM